MVDADMQAIRTIIERDKKYPAKCENNLEIRILTGKIARSEINNNWI